MLISLLKYEFMKKWKSIKYILLGYTIIQVILLVITKILFDKDRLLSLSTHVSIKNQSLEMPLILSMVCYIMISIFIAVFPFIEGFIRYEKDISGKQSPLELMLPAPSWNKILSKLITFITISIICAIIVITSISLLILVMRNFDKQGFSAIFDAARIIFKDYSNVVFLIIYFPLVYIVYFLIACLCSSIAKAVTHKKKTSELIALIVLGILFGLIMYLSGHAEKYPIISFRFTLGEIIGLDYSLSSIILYVSVLLVTFWGNSYIMEKKIEC